MKKTFIFALVGAILSLAACQKEVTYPEEATASGIPTEEFYKEGGSFTVLVKTNVVLDVKVSDTWVKCTDNPTIVTKSAVPAENKAFTFTVDEWDVKGDKTRSADVTIEGEGVAPIEFKVTQKTGEVFSLVSVDPEKGEVANEGGQLTIQINTNVEYVTELNAEDSSWIVADENNSTTGTIVRYNIAANESFTPRTAVITLKAEGFEDIVVNVNQLSQIRGISTAADLVAFSAEWAAKGNQGDYSKWVSEDEGKIIILANDIDMSGIDNWAPIADFKPGKGKCDLTNVKMSYNDCQTFLNFTFDGQGYSIKNWNINIVKDEVPAEGLIYGLFGVGSGITIKNVNIDKSCTLNVDIKDAKGPVAIAPIIALCNNCIIENCNSALQINSVNIETSLSTSKMAIVSGLVGYFKTNNQNRTKWIKNCTFSGKADNVRTNSIFASSTPSVLAGIVGWVFGQTKGASEAVIENCVNNGNLKAQFLRVGGVIGTASQDAIIHNCVNNGTVELQSFEGCTITTCYAGGVIGFESCQVADSFPEMHDCVNNGTVVGYGNLVSVGGLAGCTKNTSMKNCSNTGLVVCTSTADPKYHGLLVGCLNPTTNADRPQPSYENIKIGGRYATGYSDGTVSGEVAVSADNYFELAAFERSAWANGSKWNKTNVTFAN